ncbi:MAG TPA: DinB family protein [Cyclobacteriaceae bacterium]
MKNIRLIFLFLPLLAMNFTAVIPELTSAERKQAVDYMKKTREDLLKSIKGLSPKQLNFKSSPESWSVAECVEHLAISETNLFGLIQNTLKEAANPARRAEIKITDKGLFDAIIDRSHKIKTQEAFVPTGRFGTHQATLKEFSTKRDAAIKYIETTPDDLRNHFFTFPDAALGTVDSYQLLIFIAAHSKRHTLQIEEVKSNPAFPKK